MAKTKEKPFIIQFVGKKSEPTTKIINGGKAIELPDAETQRKGFTHADSKFLLKNYRKFYKQKITKGKNK